MGSKQFWHTWEKKKWKEKKKKIFVTGSKRGERKLVWGGIYKAENSRHLGPDAKDEKFRFDSQGYKSYLRPMMSYEWVTFNTKYSWLYFRRPLKTRMQRKQKDQLGIQDTF